MKLPEPVRVAVFVIFILVVVMSIIYIAWVFLQDLS